MRTRSTLALVASLLLAHSAHGAPPRFAAPFLSYPSGFDSHAIAVADVNGDGHPDVLVPNSTGLEVRLGAGDGTLGPAIVTAAGMSLFIVAGDLDGDGHADVVLTVDSLHVATRKGNGDGTFQSPVPFSVAKGPSGACLADLNGDGALDLVCTARNGQALSVLLGNGSGGFGAPTNIPLGVFPGPVATGDLDHDGDLDVVVADRGASMLYRLLGDGTGALAPAGTIPLPNVPASVVLADLDGDSWLDAVAGSPYVAAFFVVPGAPGGGFGTPTTQAASDGTSGLVVRDFDGDSHLDVAVLEYNLNRGEVRRGLGAFAFAPAQPFAAARNAFDIASADMNGGGKPDLVTICPYGPLSVHMGNGDGTFGGVQDLATGSLPWAIASGDLDTDGHPDLVTANIGDATLSVRFGNGAGAFAAPISLATGIEPHGVTIADADGDGHLDLVVAEHGPGTQSSSIVSVFRGNGARAFGPRIPLTVGRWAEEVAVDDLTGDGLPDLAVACNDFTATLTVLEGLGNAQWGNRQDFVLGSNATGVAIGDVTRDGKPDIVLAAGYSNTVHVLPGNANGTYGSPFALGMTSPVDVAIGDIAGDSSRDLIASSITGISVFASSPGGGFAPRVDYPGTGLWTTVADLDGDGRADVAAASNWPSNTVSVWFGQSGGGLGPVTSFGGGNRPFGVTAADVDGDGALDLACANLESSTISLLLNTGGVAWLPWLGVPPTASTIPGFALRLSPNPAHGPASIRYRLPRAAHVRLRLLDVVGREVRRLEEGDRPAGEHLLPWSSRGLPAGIGFLELVVDREREVRRVVLLP